MAIRGGNVPGCNRRQSYGTASTEPVYVVEGLFAYLRMLQLGFGRSTVALLGSVLTDGKLAIFEDMGRAIYWFTDNDAPGEACLKGLFKKELGDHEWEAGALYKLYHHVAQFIPEWPDAKDDPDQLTRDEVLTMAANAELYVKA